MNDWLVAWLFLTKWTIIFQRTSQVVCLEIAPVAGKVSPAVHAPKRPLPLWRANAVIAWMRIPYSGWCSAKHRKIAKGKGTQHATKGLYIGFFFLVDVDVLSSEKRTMGRQTKTFITWNMPGWRGKRLWVALVATADDSGSWERGVKKQQST